MIHVHLPPLRERQEDIPALCSYLIKTLTSLPTFTVLTQPSYFTAITSAGYPVLPEVTKVDFVVTTIFDTDK